MSTWSKRKRDRRLAFARFLDRWAAGIRARVKAHTPKRRIAANLISAAGDGAPVGATAAKSGDLHDARPAARASVPDVTSAQGALL
jgi:hypothetical protein